MTALLGRARAGIERLAGLVQVGDDDRRVVLEGVEHAIAMVGIDVDVGDRAQPVPPPQRLDHDATVVEHAEARGAVARRVVQPADRHEGAGARVRHDPLAGQTTRRADHGGRGLVDAATRRIPTVEAAGTRPGLLAHEVDVGRRMEQWGYSFGARLELDRAP